MKTQFLLIPVILALTARCACGQGTTTFTYDQQSADESHMMDLGFIIQSNQPAGQSFTPLLASVGFVRLHVISGQNSSSASTLYVNLRSDSITGAVLAVTAPLHLTGIFADTVNFFFTNAVPVNAGTTYFFQPVVVTADTGIQTFYGAYNYPGGAMFLNGAAISAGDLWFREGTYDIVPEPSTFSLILASGVAWRYTRRLRAVRRSG